MEELARLKRLQALTLVALIATLGVTVYGRFYRSPSVEALVEQAVEKRLASMHAPDVPDLAPVVSAFAARLEAVERRPRAASVVASFDRRFACRVTNSRRGLVAEVQEGDTAPTSRALVSAADGRIELASEVAKLDRPALLFAQALVRTDNGIREPLRLALACSGPAGTREVDLAGGFFAASKVLADDVVLKTESNTCVFIVGEGSRLELLLDVAKLRGSLKESGVFEVLVRLGPLVAFEGAVR